jgi:hypothetical protein
MRNSEDPALADYDDDIARALRIEGVISRFAAVASLSTTPVVRASAAMIASRSRRAASPPACRSSTVAWWPSKRLFALPCAGRSWRSAKLRARRLITLSPTLRSPQWRALIAQPGPRCSTSAIPVQWRRRRRKSGRKARAVRDGLEVERETLDRRRGEHPHGNRHSEDHAQRVA